MKIETVFTSPEQTERSAVDRRAAMLATIAAILALLAVYRPTLWSMVHTWLSSNTFAYGVAVAPICLWLIWRQRAELAILEAHALPLALPAIALAGFIWLVGNVAAVASIQQFSLVAMLDLTVLAVLGGQMTRALVFPLGFLFSAVPVGDFLIPILMDLTASFTTLGLKFVGIPVYRDGTQLHIPSGTWNIASECSGIRYLAAALTAGVLYAYLRYRSIARRLAFVALTLAVAIAANWLRAFLIVLLGHLTNNRIAAGADHVLYGWLFFGVIIVLLFGVGRLWHESTTPRPIRWALSGRTVAASRLSVSMPVFVAAGAAMTFAIWPWLASSFETASTATPVNLPPAVARNGWHDQGPPPADVWQPHLHGSSAERLQTFSKGDVHVVLYLALYARQTKGQLVAWENEFGQNGDSGWIAISAGRNTVSWAGVTIDAQAVDLQRSPMRLAIRKWYWIDGRYTSSDYIAKAQLTWLRLTGRPDTSAAIFLYTRADGAQVDPQRTLQNFATGMSTEVMSVLHQATQR